MRVRYAVLETLGYLLCELAFKTDCRGPFAYAYRAGCWCYGKAHDLGVRCGALVKDPDYREGGDQPQYIQR